MYSANAPAVSSKEHRGIASSQLRRNWKWSSNSCYMFSLQLLLHVQRKISAPFFKEPHHTPHHPLGCGWHHLQLSHSRAFQRPGSWSSKSQEACLQNPCAFC
jgi:hypothetical protein